MCSRLAMMLFFTAATLAHAGGVYWTDRGASQLKRMQFDGTNLQTINLSGAVTSPGSNIRGIAVDVLGNRIFWADNGNDRLLRADFDGTSSTILYSTTPGTAFPADVRLDLVNQLLYWCDQQRNKILRSTLSGVNPVDVITNAAPAGGDGPYFMDLNVPAGKLYWGDFNAGAIYRANLDGTSRETLLTGNNQTRGVCLDRTEGMLYWINRNDGKVHRCPLSAFASGTITLAHPAVQTLYTNLDTPHGLVLDIPARKLYWADTGSNMTHPSNGRTVCRGDFDGSTAHEILFKGTTANEPWDVDLDRRCTNYTEWVTRCFRRDASFDQKHPSADPDNDGIPNSLEYAFDLAPLHADLSGKPEGFVIGGPVLTAVYHGVKFRRRAGTTDLTFFIQVSTNLTAWTGSPGEPQTIEVQAQSLSDGTEEVTARTTYAVNEYPAHFMRLRVQLQAPPGFNAPLNIAPSTVTLTPDDASGDHFIVIKGDNSYAAAFSDGSTEEGDAIYATTGDTSVLVLTPVTASGVSTIRLTFDSSQTAGTYTSDTVGSGTFTVTH
jgi:hypothetical protein